MSSLSWRPWRRSWARCCANAALRLLGAPHSGARVSAYKRFGGAETLGPAEFISAGPFQLPQGPRRRSSLRRGMADQDVKSILETLEKELGAVLR